jgi:hypothetical protein
LPTVPNCNDLRWVQETSGVTFLYLATFGWSVLRRPLNFEEVLKPVTVDGQMELVDRVLVGKDDIVHPKFSATRMLGPLHPFEKLKFVEDDTGGEARAVLKLSLAWKTDFSVLLTVSADLIDRSDHDAVDAHADDTVTIAFGTVESVVIDLDSGGVELDRGNDQLVLPSRRESLTRRPPTSQSHPRPHDFHDAERPCPLQKPVHRRRHACTRKHQHKHARPALQRVGEHHHRHGYGPVRGQQVHIFAPTPMLHRARTNLSTSSELAQRVWTATKRRIRWRISSRTR